MINEDKEITPEKIGDLLNRLRGIYNIPVNDGAGTLNGKDTFTRNFPVPPINNEAAAVIESLQRNYLDKCTELKDTQQWVDLAEHLKEENRHLHDQLKYVYKPCFNKVTDYVQSHASGWSVKYLGMSCHDVIIDRCEKLEEELKAKCEELELWKKRAFKQQNANQSMQQYCQRLLTIIEKQREALKEIAYGCNIVCGGLSESHSIEQKEQIAKEALAASDHLPDATKKVPNSTPFNDPVITHEQQCMAADYAATLDYEARVRMVNLAYAEETKVQLSLGAFRAFEWLKDNGFKVTPTASKRDV